MYPMGSANQPGKNIEAQKKTQFSLPQEFSLYSPEKQSCVANQTLTDEECLVPCYGLYADITDDSLNQNVISLEQNTMKGLDSNCINDTYLIDQSQVFIQWHKS